MTVREMYLACVVFAILGVARQVAADDQIQPSRDLFESSKVTLDTIANRPEASAAKEEIVVARRYMEHGHLLLRAGHTRKASIFAERLQLQLELVRAIVATEVAKRSMDEIEKEISQLDSELKDLKKRQRQLLNRKKQKTNHNGVSDGPSGEKN